MQIGKSQYLKIARETEHGYYLTDENGHEVLLPGIYKLDNMSVGNEIPVFIYKDSKNRLVATTETPALELNQFAYLIVKETGKYGAFVDWGIAKDLLIPFAEQNVILKTGQSYIVCLIHDVKTDRLIGSTKINKYLQFNDVSLSVGQQVKVMISGANDLGFTAIVENKYHGMLFRSDVHKPIKVGQYIDAFVKQVREDGKVDLTLEAQGYDNSISQITDKILQTLEKHNGSLDLNDKSDPEQVKYTLGMSKKAFKRGIGKLLKDKKIKLSEKGIHLL
jgi:uncharacterized protein